MLLPSRSPSVLKQKPSGGQKKKSLHSNNKFAGGVVGLQVTTTSLNHHCSRRGCRGGKRGTGRARGMLHTNYDSGALLANANVVQGNRTTTTPINHVNLPSTIINDHYIFASYSQTTNRQIHHNSAPAQTPISAIPRAPRAIAHRTIAKRYKKPSVGHARTAFCTVTARITPEERKERKEKNQIC